MLEDHLLFLENELSSKNVNEHIVSSSPLLQPLMDFKYTQRIGKSRGPEIIEEPVIVREKFSKEQTQSKQK